MNARKLTIIISLFTVLALPKFIYYSTLIGLSMCNIIVEYRKFWYSHFFFFFRKIHQTFSCLFRSIPHILVGMVGKKKFYSFDATWRHRTFLFIIYTYIVYKYYKSDFVIVKKNVLVYKLKTEYQRFDIEFLVKLFP